MYRSILRRIFENSHRYYQSLRTSEFYASQSDLPSDFENFRFHDIPDIRAEL